MSFHMAPRPNWKGYLKLWLASRAVALFPASTIRERVRFNIINRKTGHRVRYEVIDAAGSAPPMLPPQASNAVNLMDALRRSVPAQRRGTAAKRIAHRGRAAQRSVPDRRKQLRQAS